MDQSTALQNLLNGTASEEELILLKQLLASGEISIGGNVNHSVIIIGNGNTVELPPAALDRLDARQLLGNLDRDLTGKEIAFGLDRLESELPVRAPVLLAQFQEQTRRLRPSLKTTSKSLSEHAREERVEALSVINSLCLEALDISFNALCLGEEPPEYDSRSPFRGLESFRPEDSEFFFGREALIQKLASKIKVHSFLAVLGASGSGKSSLVMAGMIPALASDYIIFRPGTNPLGELESARGKSLIVVDQFEELFTLTRDESMRKDFIARLLDEASRARIILTLRSDFLEEVAHYRKLNEEVQTHLENVPPMDMDELRRAMEEQAGVVGLRFEADLSQQILDDVAGEPGAMPLLQHALWELWNRRHGRNLRASEYRAFGGVKQAITSTAEKVYAECSKPEQDSLRNIFLRLTRLDEGDEGRDTRRRVPIGDLIPSGSDATSITLLLDKLANARLIVKTVNEDKTEVEVAHEALIRHWERLRIWLNEDRDALRLLESVSESAKEWEKSGRHESLLNSRWVKLDEALLLAQDPSYRLTEIEQAYLKGCAALRNREQRERERRLRYTVFASIAAAVIFLVLAGFGLVKSNEAERQAQIALARQLASQAQSLNAKYSSNQMTSSLLSIQSLKLYANGDAANLLTTSTSARPIFRMPHDIRGTSVAFSLDGKYVVSGSYVGAVSVWEVASGKEISLMQPNDLEGKVSVSVRSVAFSPDGKYVVSGSSDNTVRVWEVASGKGVSRMTHGNSVTSVAFSSDGKYVVSGSNDGTARVWEAASGKEISRMTQGNSVNSVAFSPDGKYVVSGSYDGTARVWEAASGKEISRMRHGNSVDSVAFSPNGKYVVSGSIDDTARVWEAVNGKEVSRMTHDNFVTPVAFSPDGKYVVSGSWDNTARLWEVASGREISRMIHNDDVDSVAFSPDGKYVVSGSKDGTARVWEAASGKEISRMTHDGSVYTVAFSPDGKYVVSGGNDGTTFVWEASNRKEGSRMTHDGEVNLVAFSPDGKYVVSGSLDNTARVWDVASGKEISHMTHDDSVLSVAFSPDGNYVISRSKDRTAIVWDVTSGREISRMIIDGFANPIAFSLDGKYVVSVSSDRIAHVWEVASGKDVSRFIYYNNLLSVAFSPDGKYVVTGFDGDTAARVWEVASGKEVSRMRHGNSVDSVAFSPNGKYVVTGSYDGTVFVWETASGKKISRMLHNDSVYFIAFSPDGKYVVTRSSDDTVRVWNATSGKEISQMTHDGDSVDSVAFSPDGKYVVTGSSDDTVRVWEVANGREISRMMHDGDVLSVAFSPDGKYVVSGSSDNTVHIWEWRTEDLISNACNVMPRNLTRSEWNQYIGDALPYQAVCPNLPIEP